MVSEALGLTIFSVCFLSFWTLIYFAFKLKKAKEQSHAENLGFSDTSRANALQRKQEQK